MRETVRPEGHVTGKFSATRRMLLSLPPVQRLYRKMNNQHERDDFVKQQLANLPRGALLLDAGCGSQRYRSLCEHLVYRAQDFAKYVVDEKQTLGTNVVNYEYGQLDYVGDIWAIQAPDATFDAVLCTEVLEHVPYPNETLRELVRVLKPNGVLIVTAPSNSLRHMDPFFFFSGFSDRWYQRMAIDYELVIERLEAVGDYYSWMSVELARTASTNSFLAALWLLPAFLYFRAKRRSEVSVDTLCMGYHFVARKR